MVSGSGEARVRLAGRGAQHPGGQAARAGPSQAAYNGPALVFCLFFAYHRDILVMRPPRL